MKALTNTTALFRHQKTTLAITTACLVFAAAYASAGNKALTITSFDFPGAFSTAAQGDNDRGDIVGFYVKTSADTDIAHGFILSRGVFTTINIAGATGGTAPRGINSRGDIVGEYSTVVNGPSRGFLLRNGSLTKIDYPLATDTFVKAINASGDIVGFYFDAAGNEHGFRYSNGTYTML